MEASRVSQDTTVCLLDNLNDDSLIVIFSFLSIYDKITATWVCSRWRRALKEHQSLWTKVEFKSEKSNKTEHVERTLKCLYENCPEITRMSCTIPKFTRLVKYSELVFEFLGKFRNLQYLCLQNGNVTKPCMLALTENIQLRELTLLGITCQINQSISLDEILKDTVAIRLPELNLFRLNFVKMIPRPRRRSPFNQVPGLDISGFLESIVHWKNLRRLELTGLIKFTDDAYCKLVSALSDIAVLSLGGEFVSDEILRVTTVHLKQLIDLKLVRAQFTDGRRYLNMGDYSIEGLGNLKQHPTLQKLSLYLDHFDGSAMIKVYRIICSLPEITCFKILGDKKEDLGEQLAQLNRENITIATKSNVQIIW